MAIHQMFRKRSQSRLAPSSTSALLSKFNGISQKSHSLPLQTVDNDDNKYVKKVRTSEKGGAKILGILAVLYLVKRMIFPLSHEQLSYIDTSVRNLWVVAERWGVIEPFPVYKTDYFEDFPYFSLLEENYEIIREEAKNLLEGNRDQIPRLKDLVESKRSIGRVYKTDWKTYWFKMGQFIPENEARAPKTAALLHQIPDVYNAFFSVLEPHQHIDPHWGHYKGFLRYHLGLIVPHNNTNKDCFLRIRNDIEKNTSLWLFEREELLSMGTFYYWHEGEGVMFDDNPLHDATNNSDEERVVLFLDVARKLPWYLDIINRISIFVANRQSQIVNMRKRAILDENAELSVG